MVNVLIGLVTLVATTAEGGTCAKDIKIDKIAGLSLKLVQQLDKVDPSKVNPNSFEMSFMGGKYTTAIAAGIAKIYVGTQVIIGFKQSAVKDNKISPFNCVASAAVKRSDADAYDFNFNKECPANYLSVFKSATDFSYTANSLEFVQRSLGSRIEIAGICK